MGYQTQTFKGISWMSALRFITRGLAVLKFVVLARFLTPAQFGYYGVALLVLGLTEIITETGINIFLIQAKEDFEKYIDTAWVISIFRGFLVGLAIYIFAVFVARAFSLPETTNLIRLVSAVPVIKGFINPAVIRFQKELSFSREFIFKSSIFFTDAFLALTLGILTRSENAMVVSMLAAALVEVVLGWMFVKPTPRFSLNVSYARKVIGDGKWITFSGTFEYLFQHLDDIAVGRFLGAVPLGLYQQAYRIATLPISESEQIVSRVTLPVYTSISSDIGRLKKAFIKVTLLISFFVVPFGVALVLFGEKIILVILGPSWAGAVPALKLLAVFGIIKALANSGHSLFLSLRKQSIVTVVTFAGIVGLALPLYWLTTSYGIVGAAISAIIGAVAAISVTIYYVIRFLFDIGRI